jgi:predicted adenylyl cyclase CyaB
VERRNVELKARDRDHRGSLAACVSLGAEERGALVQRDTYFHAAQGRLKLREEKDEVGARAHLIAYERPDLSEERVSRYRIVAVERPAELKAALAAALGIEAVVAKRRRLFLWRQVRIHLDEVGGLGRFVELEAVAGEKSDLSCEEELVRALRREFAIEDADLIGVSYGDLVAVAASATQSAGGSSPVQ